MGVNKLNNTDKLQEIKGDYANILSLSPNIRKFNISRESFDFIISQLEQVQEELNEANECFQEAVDTVILVKSENEQLKLANEKLIDFIKCLNLTACQAVGFGEQIDSSLLIEFTDKILREVQVE